jgi:hypothetical protein
MKPSNNRDSASPGGHARGQGIIGVVVIQKISKSGP